MTGIPMGLNILLLTVFILTGFMESRRLSTKHIQLEGVLKKAGYLYLLLPVSGILLTIAFLNNPSFLWNMPLWLHFHYLAAMWGIILAIFAFTFSLACFVSFRTSHRERWKVVLASTLLIAAIQIMQWNYTRPVAPHLKDSVTPSGLVIQTSDTSCAAASAASILRRFGMEMSEREMAELFRTTLFGTSAAHVIYGMQRIGIRSRKVEIEGSNPEHLKFPAMIFIGCPSAGTESHAVAYMGFHEGKAEIWDPVRGKRFLDKNQLGRIWHGRGIEFQLDKEL
jgi:hypothetical protein